MTPKLFLFSTVVVLTAITIAPPVDAQSRTAYFPSSTSMGGIVVPATATSGGVHMAMFVKLSNLDLFAVGMTETGEPAVSARGGSWIYGRLTDVREVGPGIIRLTWMMFISPGGPTGTFTNVNLPISIDVPL